MRSNRLGRVFLFLPQVFDPFEHDGQNRDNNDGDDDEAEIALYEGDVTKPKPGPHENRDPADSADHIETHEARIAHRTDAGDEGREGPHDWHKSRDDDGPA